MEGCAMGGGLPRTCVWSRGGEDHGAAGVIEQHWVVVDLGIAPLVHPHLHQGWRAHVQRQCIPVERSVT